MSGEGDDLFWTQTQEGEDSIVIRLAQRYAMYLPEGVSLGGATREQILAAITKGLQTDRAMTRSGAWMKAGSPPHAYQAGPVGWCRVCGCGEPGQQHHAGGADRGPVPAPVALAQDPGHQARHAGRHRPALAAAACRGWRPWSEHRSRAGELVSAAAPTPPTPVEHDREAPR
jgi:hypothetical protein